MAPAIPASRRGDPAKPNIIVILADDLGYADISAYRGGRFSTPNIERIAVLPSIPPGGAAAAGGR